MPEFFALMAPFMQTMGQNMANQFTSNMIQSMFSRGDFAYTHRMNSINAQVAQMRSAGLNPALAYGQISAPQGQSLGQYNSDYAAQEMARAQAEKAKQDIETQKANTRYLDALAFKTRMEGVNREFLNTHQEDAWKVDYANKSLMNLRIGSEIRKIDLSSDWQEIENQIRSIDLKYHDQKVRNDIAYVVAETGLKLAMSKTENALRDARLREIQANTRTLMSMYSYYGSLTNLTNNQAALAKYDGLLKKTESLYMSWLTSNNKDFSKLDARNKFETYGKTITQGISTVLGVGASIYLGKGLAAGRAAAGAGDAAWSTYGPGRDNLGH